MPLSDSLEANTFRVLFELVVMLEESRLWLHSSHQAAQLEYFDQDEPVQVHLSQGNSHLGK